MRCSDCGQENREGRRFCGGCGVRLALGCPACGTPNEPGERFCGECGASLAASPGPTEPASASRPGAGGSPAESGARKVVTIVFADLVGSTALHERLEPESARRFMEAYYVAMRGAVESHGGTVTQLLGDGVKAVFGIPRVAEDDAIRAVRAAVAMQDAFRALAEQQRGAVGATGLRVAVNTGEVVANDETEIIGDPVNVAARLQEQGGDGDVVVGESTHRLVSTLVTLELLGNFALKGRSEAVKAYRVVSLERPAGVATAPFVGRDEEIARLGAVYDTANGKPAAALAVLVGSPGLGKSRLIDEFARRHADAATVVQAHCDAAGGATFAPLAVALRELLGIEDGASADALRATIEGALSGEEADRARIAAGIAALLEGSPASPEETFFVVRRMLGALARTRPVVLVIDDLHWAEPLLLDLVEHLIQWGSGVPLFVLIGARPELRDLRSSLVTPGGLVSDVVTLAGLDAGAAMRLAANVIGAADLPAAIAAKVLATSEGNPLFVGELVRMLVQEGALTKEGDRWTVGANLAALEMPPTIHALLAARIERLRPEERAVLERAAVVGRHFSRSAVAALMPREAGALDARLEALRRSELIERDTGWLLGEPVLRFHHVLIRDAAYRRLLKGTRAELHAKLADWIEAQVGDAAEHDETIGWHLEQAHQFLRELGPVDASGARLGERAARRLAAAGRRALARDDLPVAADLVGRAIDRLDADDPARAELALDWCEALLASGDVAPAVAAIEVLGRFAADSERLRAWHTCFVGQHTVLTAPSALHATAGAVATAAEELTAQGDAAGEAKAHFVHALALSRLGKVGACEAALDRALAAARRAGDRRRANTVLAIAPLAALWGPSPVTRASGRCLDVVRVLRITQGAPAVEAVALSCQGVLEALRGRGDAARRMIASARKMVEELGITQRLLEVDVFGGLVDLLEGDAPAAEISLRGAYAGLRELGLGIDAARSAALLARALLAQERVAEAEALSHESEALAGDDLKAAIAWRGVRAEALARRGEHAAAVEFASKAVELAAATDALLDHADARLALAAALRAAGRRSDADAEERRARDLWHAKGATLLAERAPLAAATTEATVAAAAPRAAHTPRRRPVRQNFAFEEMRRAEGAVAARDARALEALYRRDVEIVDHQFGITYGYAEIVERVRAIIEDSTESAFAHEPLASLGDALALCRMRSTASGSTVHGISIGATEAPYLLLIEADEEGSARRIEIFGDDKLADAVVRLYERHAELMPIGPERERAAAVASAIGSDLLAPGDPERIARGRAEDFESIDHRHLSTWSVRGRDAYLEHVRAIQEVATDIVMSVDEVLALEAGAIVVRRVNSGTDRAGGGRYERPFLALFATDAAGQLARAEWFDADREGEALARFDALAADALPQRAPRRRVRANAATRTLARYEAYFAAGDADAIVALYQEDSEELNHPTGTSYGRAGGADSLRRLLRASDPYLTHAPLATLGDSLALARRSAGASASSGTRFDVGAWERAEVFVAEVGSDERLSATEIFASDHLGDAIVRLYERHAERMPEGAARTRAESTARSVAAVAPGGFDRDRYAAAFRADVEIVDHRLVGLGSYVGSDALFRSMTVGTEVGDLLASRPQDVLALTHDALLLRWRTSGVGRESGGAFEWAFLRLFVFDQEGRVARYELFEDDREAERLARFDALVAASDARGGLMRRVRVNAASRSTARFVAALDARDADALPGFFDDALRVVHHPSGSSYGKRAMLATWRSALRAERLEFRGEPIATLGDTLVLSRQVTAVEGLRELHLADFGSTEVDEISFVETNADGRWLRVELFAPDRLGDAVVLLYERHAAQQPEGSGRARAEATAQAAIAMMRSIDLDRMAAAFAPDLRLTDHRVLATWSAETGAELVAHFRHHLELAPDFAPRVDDVLALEPRALVARITFVGTARDSGGAFENRCCVLYRFGDDGCVAEIDCFEAEQVADALALFDALAGRSPEAAAEPFANAASRLVARGMHELWAARDWDGIVAMISPAIRMDDRRRIVRLEIGYDEFVAQFRMLFDQPGSHWREQLVATRGERLALTRTCFEAEVADGGGPLAFDEHLSLAELDAEGRIVAFVTFDLDAEDAAYAELDARFAADAGEAHGRTTVAFDRAIARRDWDAVAALCSPAFVEHDHRSLAVLGTTRGGEAWMQNFRALVELAPDTIYRTLHARGAARGFLSVGAWLGSREGGRYEIPLLAVCEVDAQGAIARVDLYEPDQQDQALARFAALATPACASEPFANAASRANRSLGEASNARDFARIEALLVPSLVFDDRRRLNRLKVGREEALAHYRFLQEVPRGRFSSTLLATRGERLALHRTHFEGEVAGGGGAVDVEDVLDLAEIDAEGRVVANLLFDLEDEDAAYAELDARFAAGEGAPYAAARSWREALAASRVGPEIPAMLALFAPAFVARDHRLVGWGTLQGADSFLVTLRTLAEMAPDVQYRADHVRSAHRAILAAGAWFGTHDGGAFESPSISLVELDEAGCAVALDLYDLQHAERALARFAELAAAAASEGRFENAASRAWRAVNDAWSSRDAARFEALHPRALRYRDHRRLFQLDLDRAGFLDFTRPLIEMRAGRASLELVATRGERLALMHSTMQMADEAIGPSVIESLMMIEVDERGDIAVYDRWNLEDADAAWAELDARWNTGEGAQHAALRVMREFGASLERRDWDVAAACYAPEFVGHDHRLVSWGTVHGPSALMRALQEMIVLAPDARMRLHHRRACARGTISDITWVGTRDGGAFESPFINVAEAGADGRIVRADFYDPHHLDRALARFEELRASERRDPRAAIAKPNLATAAMEHNWATFGVVDLDAAQAAFDAARANFAPDFVWEDRRPLVGLSGDVDLMFASARERIASGARQQGTILGTAGERIAIARVLWAGGPQDGRFEVEFLVVCEVDAAGLCTAAIFFEPHDTRAAQREAWARWAAIDPLVAPWVELLNEITDGWNAHDIAGARAFLAEDIVVDDHRLAGIGRIDGVDAYVDSFVALWNLAPDQRIEFGWSWLAVDRHGLVTTMRRAGTLPEGGAFESEYVWLSLVSGGRATRLELFEIDAIDAALTRFEELRPRERSQSDPLHIPPNAATRAAGRIAPLYANADLPALRAIVSDDFVFDDRTRGSLLRGGVEEWVNGMRFLRTETHARLDRRVIATAGDRLALYRTSWQETPGESSFLIERFALYEIDAAGKLRACVLFDAADHAAAHAELFERHVALGADDMPACMIEFARAIGARDAARMRAVLADDFVYHDRRRTGAGRLDGPDAYLASPRAWWALSDDARMDVLYRVATAPHGRVAVNRMAGTNHEGGAFESLMVTLVCARDGHITVAEMFESDQLDAALARLEELRPDPLRIPPNAATRSLVPVAELVGNGDLDALRALVTDDFCFDDRTRRSLLRGGVEEWVRALEYLSSEARAQLDARLVATAGDRLALYHDVWQEAPGESRFRMESHRLVEVDAAGRLRALVLFDANDRAAAAHELADRYVRSTRPEAAERMRELQDAWRTRDFARLRAQLPDDFVLHDRRRTGLGRIEGADAYVTSVAALDELSADAVVGQPLYYLADEPHGSLSIAHSFGTLAEGGAFETVYAMITLHGPGGMIGTELFELEDLEAAKARFEELRPDPLSIPPTAATRLRDRHRDAFIARDWDAIRALAGADFVFEDRGRRALVRGDVEAWIASMQFTTQPGFRSDSTLLGTLGDLIVIDRVRWFGKPDGDAFEFERVRLLEVDADGLLRAVLFFDPEDREAASFEGLARFGAGEAGGSPGIAPMLGFSRALYDRDWEAVRDCYAPDVAFVDHRPLGFGSLDRDAWIAALRANDDLSAGLTWDLFRVLAWNDQGFAVGLRRRGTSSDGDGPFENEFFAVALVVDGRFQRYEIFGEADAERAAARLAELSAEPSA